MSANAHPFVVARNKSLDWRPLLAPDPLIDAGEDYALVLETAAQHPTPVTVRPWQDSSGAAWVLVYRSVAARQDFVGQPGTDQLTDRFGRALYLVEGVAVRDGAAVSAERAQELVERAHAHAVPAFRDFWPSEDESVGVQVSRPFDPDVVESPDASSAPDAPDETTVARSWGPWVLVAGIVVVLAVMIVVAVVVGGSGSGTAGR